MVPSPEALPAPRPGRPRYGWLLWILALLVTLAAAVYQRMTGPTWPLRVHYVVGTTEAKARLDRTGTTGESADVEVPAPGENRAAVLRWRRYPTREEYVDVAMVPDGDVVVGSIPSQPPAGKVQYHVVVREVASVGERTTVRIPADPADDPVLRFKGAVPLWILVPHVAAMFLAMWVALRAGLAALLRRPEVRRLSWVALAGLTVGGLVLGPITQKYAFGAFWTGWPFGEDLTDNKLLATWIAWLVACLVLGWRATRRERAGRWAVLVAVVVLLATYLVPHSLRGSQLDYERLSQGTPAEDAIDTGR